MTIQDQVDYEPETKAFTVQSRRRNRALFAAAALFVMAGGFALVFGEVAGNRAMEMAKAAGESLLTMKASPGDAGAAAEFATLRQEAEASRHDADPCLQAVSLAILNGGQQLDTEGNAEVALNGAITKIRWAASGCRQ